MKTDLTNRYYLLTSDTERNRDAAEKFAEVLGMEFKFGDLALYKYYQYLRKGDYDFICNYTHNDGKTPITYEELCEAHREWKETQAVLNNTKRTIQALKQSGEFGKSYNDGSTVAHRVESSDLFDSFAEKDSVMIITKEYRDSEEEVVPVLNQVSVLRAKEIIASLQKSVEEVTGEEGPVAELLDCLEGLVNETEPLCKRAGFVPRSVDISKELLKKHGR